MRTWLRCRRLAGCSPCTRRQGPDADPALLPPLRPASAPAPRPRLHLQLHAQSRPSQARRRGSMPTCSRLLSARLADDGCSQRPRRLMRPGIFTEKDRDSPLFAKSPAAPLPVHEKMRQARLIDPLHGCGAAAAAAAAAAATFFAPPGTPPPPLRHCCRCRRLHRRCCCYSSAANGDVAACACGTWAVAE